MSGAGGRLGAALLVVALVSALPPDRAAAGQRGSRQQSAAGSGSQNPTQGVELSEQQLRNMPAARDLWALLEHRVPAVVTDRLDVGGSDVGRQALFSARSTSWQQNAFRLDGVETTDPAVRGTSGFYFDYDTFTTVNVSWGTQPAGVATAEVAVDLVLRAGSNEFHGAAQGYFNFDSLQANNVSDDLEARGVEPSARIDYLSDVSVQAGGPLWRDRAWIFGSYRDWRISQSVPNFSAPVRTDLPVITLKLTADRGSRDDLSVFWSRQRYLNPARYAGAGVLPEATLVEDTTSMIFAGTWAHDFGTEGRLRHVALRGSLLDIDFPLLIQEGAARQSQFDIVTQLRSGAASLGFLSSRSRYALDADTRMAAGPADAHSIGAGVQFQYVPTENSFSAIGDVNIVTGGGMALVAQLLNTPVTNKQNARAFGLYVHDDGAIRGGWTLSFGVRYDDWKGSLPAQASPAGTYAPVRDFSAQSDVLGWRGLGPRLALVGDLLGDGRLTVVAAFAQYVHQMGTSTLSFANPNSLGATVVSWTDANGDGQFQPGEGGSTMSVGGGPIGRVEDSLSAPLTREFRIGANYEVGGNWSAGIDLWYRKDSSLFDDVEVGLTAEDFVSTVAPDPGRDNIPGTEDDRGIPVFNQVENFGGNQLLLMTVDDKTVTYRGIDIRLRRRFADNWELGAVVTFGLAEGLNPKGGLVPGDSGGITDLFNDPNSLINADARMFWDRTMMLKAYGSYMFDGGFLIAGLLRSWSGEPLPRILPVPLNQGIINVYAEPRGALRNDLLTTADLRVSKTFGLARGRSAALYFDVFNLTNAGTVTKTFDTFPLFGTPAEVVPPLVTRIGARLAF